MERPPRQPPESYHSVPLQRLADKAHVIERDLMALQASMPCFDQQLSTTTQAVIELARIIRALGEYYA